MRLFVRSLCHFYFFPLGFNNSICCFIIICLIFEEIYKNLWFVIVVISLSWRDVKVRYSNGFKLIVILLVSDSCDSRAEFLKWHWCSLACFLLFNCTVKRIHIGHCLRTPIHSFLAYVHPSRWYFKSTFITHKTKRFLFGSSHLHLMHIQ